MLSSLASRSAIRGAASALPRLSCRAAPKVRPVLPKPAAPAARQMSTRRGPGFADPGFMERNKKELIMGGIGLVGITALALKGHHDQTHGYSTTKWPSYVQERLKASYAYVLGGLGVTAGTATLFFRSGAAYAVMRANPWVFMIGSLAGMWGGMYLTMSTPFEDKIMKHLSWGAVMSLMGLTVSPICLLGGPLLMRAAIATGATVGSLSLVAYNTPDDTFLSLGGPLSLGLGILIGSSLAGMLIPAYAGMAYNISLYGGLGLFSMFTLYDTQRMVAIAKTSPRYDPVNESLGLYMNIVNIFIRMAQIMGNSNKRRR